MSHAVATTLYERLGGKAAMDAVVKEFYNRVLADANLKGYFANTDMTRQMQSQIDFLTMAVGGPNQYKGRSMSDAHENMGITEHHFNLVAGHLVETLQWAKVPQELIDEVVGLVGPLKDEVVTV